jgi:16S rRNA (cytidine1402-2'-O)-methyltransferase
MAVVYLVPAPLAEDGMQAIPSYVLAAIKACSVLFVENERTARRYLKKWDSSIVIDDFKWITIHKAEREVKQLLIQAIKDQKTIGIMSEAGCPGIADPGQVLIETAHVQGAEVRPLVGPNSILLALMASGFSGQQFCFQGYLPIENANRSRRIRQLEEQSAKNLSTQIFIETPYRNNQLLETILKTCQPATRLCVAVDLTDSTEWIRSQTIREWRQQKTDLHKRPAIFLIYAGT